MTDMTDENMLVALREARVALRLGRPGAAIGGGAGPRGGGGGGGRGGSGGRGGAAARSAVAVELGELLDQLVAIAGQLGESRGENAGDSDLGATDRGATDLGAADGGGVVDARRDLAQLRRSAAACARGLSDRLAS